MSSDYIDDDMDSLDIIEAESLLEFSKGHKVRIINDRDLDFPVGTEGYITSDGTLISGKVKVLFFGGLGSAGVTQAQLYDISLEEITKERLGLAKEYEEYEPEENEEPIICTAVKFKVGDYVTVVVKDNHYDYLSVTQVETNGLSAFITWTDGIYYMLDFSHGEYYCDFCLEKSEFTGRYKTFQASDLASLGREMNSFLEKFPNYKPCRLDNFGIPVHDGWYTVILEKQDNSMFCEIKE